MRPSRPEARRSPYARRCRRATDVRGVRARLAGAHRGARKLLRNALFAPAEEAVGMKPRSPRRAGRLACVHADHGRAPALENVPDLSDGLSHFLDRAIGRSRQQTCLAQPLPATVAAYAQAIAGDEHPRPAAQADGSTEPSPWRGPSRTGRGGPAARCITRARASWTRSPRRRSLGTNRPGPADLGARRSMNRMRRARDQLPDAISTSFPEQGGSSATEQRLRARTSPKPGGDPRCKNTNRSLPQPCGHANWCEADRAITSWWRLARITSERGHVQHPCWEQSAPDGAQLDGKRAIDPVNVVTNL